MAKVRMLLDRHVFFTSVGFYNTESIKNGLPAPELLGFPIGSAPKVGGLRSYAVQEGGGRSGRPDRAPQRLLGRLRLRSTVVELPAAEAPRAPSSGPERFSSLLGVCTGETAPERQHRGNSAGETAPGRQHRGDSTEETAPGRQHREPAVAGSWLSSCLAV